MAVRPPPLKTKKLETAQATLVEGQNIRERGAGCRDRHRNGGSTGERDGDGISRNVSKIAERFTLVPVRRIRDTPRGSAEPRPGGPLMIVDIRNASRFGLFDSLSSPRTTIVTRGLTAR